MILRMFLWPKRALRRKTPAGMRLGPFAFPRGKIRCRDISDLEENSYEKQGKVKKTTTTRAARKRALKR